MGNPYTFLCREADGGEGKAFRRKADFQEKLFFDVFLVKKLESLGWWKLMDVALHGFRQSKKDEISN
ncbi:hypothetical protein HPP92_021748 [Vanilla planifolia]|uniref:Uncharacterized protein n=1 Tax=Vanilla planifolia TaxID=51239 RepID=A0A835PVZ2_VANPL|nr:hypothetical protein HPP92_021748 [Vanilla planifolia]